MCVALDVFHYNNLVDLYFERNGLVIREYCLELLPQMTLRYVQVGRRSFRIFRILIENASKIKDV